MESVDFDAIVIGAGAAGLAALTELDRAGARAVCLEARDRIGGRVYTRHDPFSPVSMELGAEFVHGRPPEIWDQVRSRGLMVHEVNRSAIHLRGGEIQRGIDGWDLVNEVLDDMQRAARSGEDQSFSTFLKSSSHSEDAKQLAASYVEGFNAARKELVSIASLKQDADAAAEIDGDRSFRLVNGYDSLLLRMISGLNDLPSKLRLNSEVERVEWNTEGATVRFRSTLTGRMGNFQARYVIVTVPLGVLQCAAGEGISFDPEPSEALEAARALRFGQVVRVVLQFREAFWEEQEEFACAAFLLSDEPFFPTWWTSLPLRAPVITGWSAGPHTDGLVGRTREAIIDQALTDLSRITSVPVETLRRLLAAGYYHDWHADRFARGAYSYVPVGAVWAREALARPLGGTLCFAGEASELNGHGATVHGAIASGRRAAHQMLQRD